MAVTKKLTIKVQQQGAKQAQREMDKLGGSVQSTLKKFAGFAIAAVSVGAVTTAVNELVKRGARLQGVERAFSKLGVDTRELEKATRGAVTQF